MLKAVSEGERDFEAIAVSGGKAGDSPETVTAFAREYLKVLESYNFQGSAKHYPGGTPPVDTHMTEAASQLTEEELIATHMQPYIRLWKEGLLHSIMVDHGQFPKIDPDGYPASLSKKVIGFSAARALTALYTPTRWP